MRQRILYHARKHPSFATTLLLLSAFFLIVACGIILLHPVRYARATSGLANLKNDIMNNYTLEYPAFNVPPVDTALRVYVAQRANKFVTLLGAEKYDAQNKLTVTYRVLHKGERFVSVRFYERQQRVNRPVVLSQKDMVFDLKNGRLVTVSDIFRNGAFQDVGGLLHDYFRQKSPRGFTDVMYVRLLQVKLSDIKDFWFTQQGLVIALNPGQLGSASGLQYISIDRGLIQESLNKPYGEADIGKDTAVDTISYSITQKPDQVVIDPNKKMLALTFDDGPKQYTYRVLDALKKYRSHATFFVLGQQVAKYPQDILRMVNENNEIGNHSWNHADLTRLSANVLHQQIVDTQQVIGGVAGGYKPIIMRPPYGAANDTVYSYVESLGLHAVLWNVDTEDWEHRDTQYVYDRIMGAAADGRVILMHDIYDTSVRAVERAIPELVSQGYQLVTVSQLEHFR